MCHRKAHENSSQGGKTCTVSAVDALCESKHVDSCIVQAGTEHEWSPATWQESVKMLYSHTETTRPFEPSLIYGNPSYGFVVAGHSNSCEYSFMEGGTLGVKPPPHTKSLHNTNWFHNPVPYWFRQGHCWVQACFGFLC